MANTSIPINTNPTSDPQYTGGEVVLPSDDSIIDINPINENAEALAKAVNQLFWDVNQGGGGGTDAQVEINRQNIGAPAGAVLSTDLQTQVTNLSSRVSTAEGNINTISTDVNTLSGTVNGLSSSVTSLGGRMTIAEGNIATDETQIGNIKSAVGIDNTGALTPTVAGTLAKQVADNTGGITNLNTQVGANVIGSTSDTSSRATVYGYVNGVKDIADANLATLQTLGGGTVPTQSLNTLVTNEVNSALSGYTPTIQPGQIGTTELASGAVTSDKIGNKEVKTINIDDGAIDSAQIANGAVRYNNLDSALQAKFPSVYLTDHELYSYTNSGGTVSCDIEYKTYIDGFTEVYIQGTMPTTQIPLGTVTIEPTVAINLTELGISASTVGFSSAYVEYDEMLLRHNTLGSPEKSVQGTLSIASNNLTLTFKFYITATGTSNYYTVVKFRAKICGDSITVTDPNT